MSAYVSIDFRPHDFHIVSFFLAELGHRLYHSSCMYTWTSPFFFLPAIAFVHAHAHARARAHTMQPCACVRTPSPSRVCTRARLHGRNRVRVRVHLAQQLRAHRLELLRVGPIGPAHMSTCRRAYLFTCVPVDTFTCRRPVCALTWTCVHVYTSTSPIRSSSGRPTTRRLSRPARRSQYTPAR